MHVRPASLLFAALLAGAASAATPPTPAPIRFDGDDYAFAARDPGTARQAEHYLRAGETLERYSRRLTIADHGGTTAKAFALGVVQLAKVRTPGAAPETFAAEGAEDRDVSVVWYDLTDDRTAVELHVARFVDLPGGGMREYHFVVRRYVNNKELDAAYIALYGTTGRRAVDWVEALSLLDRAPAPAAGGSAR